MSAVVIPADFKLPIGIAAFGLAVTGLGNVNAGFPISFVGLLLAFQATRVNFEFDDVVGGKRVVGYMGWESCRLAAAGLLPFCHELDFFLQR